MIDTVLMLRIDEEIILESKLKMCNENILLDMFNDWYLWKYVIWTLIMYLCSDIHKKWNSVHQLGFWEARMSDILLENNLSFGYRNKYRIFLV